MVWKARRPSSASGPNTEPVHPAAMTAMVPATGTRAATPGKAVVPESRVIDQTIRATPPHPMPMAAVGERRLHHGTAKARRPPARFPSPGGQQEERQGLVG